MRTTRSRKLIAVLAVSTMALAACSDDGGTDGGSATTDQTGGTTGGGAGTITVSGSSTVLPISDLAAEAFKADNPELTISVDGPGTGDGFELFCNGETDISDASRPIKEEEAAACEENGVEYVELKIAIDGLTVATSPANEDVECLDVPALYALTGPEAEGFTSWSDANDLAAEVGSDYAELPDAPLDVFGPGEESGTYDTFVEFVMKDLAEERGTEEAARLDYDSSPDDALIVEGIESGDSTLGWVGYSYYLSEAERMKAIAIAGEDGECVAPTDETIADGTYPFSRPLFIYVSTTKLADSPVLGEFVDSYLASVTDLVDESGYVNIPEADLAETQAAWDAANA